MGPLIRMEVRCCCEPGKLLGHMQVTRDMYSSMRLCIPVAGPGGFGSFELDILEFQDAIGNRYRAMQAHVDDLPTLRRIGGFEELMDEHSIHTMNMATLRLKRDQHWEHAAVSRVDGDRIGQERHAKLAREFAEEISRRVRAGEE